jgi:hypothetical protein
MDHGRVNSCFTGDLPQAGALETVFGEQPARRVQDLGP